MRFTRDHTVDQVVSMTGNLPFGGTDCALPMLYAKAKQLPVDVFIVMTDNETWAGNIQPVPALHQYREAMGIHAKLVVMAFSSSGFSIADPNDPSMLDMAGLDAGFPQVLAEFVMDKF